MDREAKWKTPALSEEYAIKYFEMPVSNTQGIYYNGGDDYRDGSVKVQLRDGREEVQLRDVKVDISSCSVWMEEIQAWDTDTAYDGGEEVQLGKVLRPVLSRECSQEDLNYIRLR